MIDVLMRILDQVLHSAFFSPPAEFDLLPDLIAMIVIVAFTVSCFKRERLTIYKTAESHHG